MKTKPTTLPGLIDALGGPTKTAEALGVSPSLPCHWKKGAHPGRKNALAIVDLARQHGFDLSLETVMGGAR